MISKLQFQLLKEVFYVFEYCDFFKGFPLDKIPSEKDIEERGYNFCKTLLVAEIRKEQDPAFFLDKGI